MRFEELLEKKEAKQVYLIKQLIIAGGQMNVHEIRKVLELTKKSIDNYIEELIEDFKPYGKCCQLTYDGATITFSKTPDFSIEEFEKALYLNSPKYQILLALLEEKEISPVRLSQELKISESSLSRKIRDLNKILKEFDLRIWQGKLMGEESQIRYFYFQLLWYLKQGYAQISARESHIIENIERGLNLEFMSVAKQRVLLWLRVTKKRITIPDPQFKQFKEKFEPYKRDPLYLKLLPIIRRSFSFYAVELKEEEIMLHFVFLTGMSVLSQKDFHAYSLQRSKMTPTAWCDSIILETILRIYGPKNIRKELEETCYYHLSQIHLRLYFFVGDVEAYDRNNIWQLEETLSTSNIQSHVNQLLELSAKELQPQSNEQNSLWAMTAIKYLSVLSIIDIRVNREVRVGIYLQLDELFKEATKNMLTLQLNSLNGVIVESFDEAKHYDLVITNTELDLDTKIYRITELGSAYDLKEIKKLIRQA
ncbi:MAG: helix-turn-helix domain-containing protein [Tetragenococcus halophilus]|uniref:Transcriptional regulator n=2 Tax=Tetragenococcus halophilus TaxID=51669 RepID=A0AAN1VRD7_TETHN|nr:helix-turn-helix domain-containing protein [Tetragenococcus halophilus]MCF1601796.1 helix-turn-helix domain-containing protein [Tetragenococcus halophilus]MDN6127708.1 helix-turn-helix domain-containing protein [Tetragenococcus halophilus]MDN6723003.1 helix-turn-helix domain-containing protein [Tetragenococcus halophilus]BAK94982.1 putative transcriptional regulator [Tetragenococcus halophilus NBRC 12172]GBD70861.1 putative transcriptional regulator [Tetragenococcus halophilus subsp. haloph